MASCGTRRIGSSIRTSTSSTALPRRTESRPLMPRSRSSQEFSQAPPYGSSATTCQPLTNRSGCCLTRRLGLSVWPPTMRNGFGASVVCHATREPARTVK